MSESTPNLRGAHVVVAGGTGNVGEAIVHELLTCGARVAVPTRGEDKAKALQAYVGPDLGQQLVVGLIDTADQQSLARWREDLIKKWGRLDGVIASLGGWTAPGPLTQMPLATWHNILTANLTSHVLMAQCFMPTLAQAPQPTTYVMVNGGAALELTKNAVAMSMVASAQLMMARGLALEHQVSTVTVCSLLIKTPIVTRSRNLRRPEWLTAQQVGRLCAEVLEARGVGYDTVITRPEAY